MKRPRGLQPIMGGLALLLAATITSNAHSQDDEPETKSSRPSTFEEFMDFVKGGKPILDVRFRYEHAKIDSFKVSHSNTIRTRLGYQTKPIEGVSGLLEFVNVATPKPSGYFDGTDSNPQNRTIVADPTVTDVNRVWLGLDRPDWWGTRLKAGRQRIILDDSRWVGNVGWRQIEQRFDAVRYQTNLGLEDLEVQYIFSWEVKRIFGDQGPRPNRDFDQKTHFVNLSYVVGKPLKVTGFAYLIDPGNDVDVFATKTFGGRLTGTLDLPAELAFAYQASYAWQQDWKDNPVGYDAHYGYVEGDLSWQKLGAVGVGYEHLGSDGGDARVVTPFATAHKFNGFADAFLDNGGVLGLQDLFVSVAPRIPIEGVKLKFIYHQFWSDKGNDDRGREYDAVLTYQFNKYLSFLYKFAYYEDGDDGSPLSRVRNTLDMTVKF